MLKYGILLYLLLFLARETSGQLTRLFLTTFNSSDGLSASSVNGVDADPDGVIWIATDNGLNRFDGTGFTRFYAPYGKQVNGLTTNEVKHVLCDSLIVWLVTANGLNCYYVEIDYFKNYVHNPFDSNSIASNAVHCLLLAADRSVYVGTDSGLSIFNRDNSRFTNIVHHPGKNQFAITSLEEFNEDLIWIGTNQQGLLYYSKKAGMHAVKNVPPVIESSTINDLMFDKEGNELWLATTNGLWRARKNINSALSEWHQPFPALRTSNVRCVTKDIWGNIWVGTSDKGVYWRDVNGTVHHVTADTRYNHALLSNHINDIFCSADGLVWFSTPKGLQNYHKSLQSFPLRKPRIRYEAKSIPAIAAGLCLWKNYVVAATDKGVWISDTNFSQSYSLFALNNKNQPVSFTTASIVDSNVLVTGSDGIYQLVMKDNRPKLVRPVRLKYFRHYTCRSSTELVKANDTIYWLAGTDNRMYIMNSISGKTTTIPLSRKSFKTVISTQTCTKLFKDREGRMLVAENGSIAVYTCTGTYIRSVSLTSNTGNILEELNVNDFYDDGKCLWLATDSRGL